VAASLTTALNWMTEATVSVVDSKALLSVFGTNDRHLRQLREALDVKVSTRGDQIHVQGEVRAVALATEALEQLKQLAHRHGTIAPEEVTRVLTCVTGPEPAAEAPVIEVFAAGRKIRPHTPGQVRYVKAIAQHDVVFCVGPAGTGKTYLAVAMAVAALKKNQIRKIVLVRPAVEAGESLGYLPGDMLAKINPYLRPLLDSLHEMIDFDQVRQLTDQDVIEVIPLAFMRGRTLNDAFIILDEAQNTTLAQMKMFLTRMGRNSKIVVSGDMTQIDLPTKATSGLIDAQSRFRGIAGIGQVTLGDADIVRHPLVQDIVRAYEGGSKKR